MWIRPGRGTAKFGTGVGSSLLHDCYLLFTHASKSLLNPASEFVLSGELDLRIFFGHPQRAVAGDVRRLDARSADLLPPRDIGAPEGVRADSKEITALMPIDWTFASTKPREATLSGSQIGETCPEITVSWDHGAALHQDVDDPARRILRGVARRRLR
jgi:hypothetical protein